jgi:hypothetical protein
VSRDWLLGQRKQAGLVWWRWSSGLWCEHLSGGDEVEMVVGWVGADGCDCSFLRRDGDDGLTPTAKASLAEPGMWGRRVPWVATTPLRGVRVEASARPLARLVGDRGRGLVSFS